MSNEVLIVAGEAAARMPAEIVRSLRFTPVVVATEEEAESLLRNRSFNLIAVSGAVLWQQVRDAARMRQPMTRVLELPPPGNGADRATRTILVRYLGMRPEIASHPTSERSQVLAAVLESFTATFDAREVVERIVAVTREQFRADRAWLLHPISDDAELAKVHTSVSAPGFEGADQLSPLPPARLQSLLLRALESSSPVSATEGDQPLDSGSASRVVRSMLLRILRTAGGEPWAFGIQRAAALAWTPDEIALFGVMGGYATLALNNMLLQSRALCEMAKVNAILDEMPEASAIYDSKGHLERMNAAARRDAVNLFSGDPDERVRVSRHRYLDGTSLAAEELPSMRALRGESVRSDYLIGDPRGGDDRVVNFKAAPIRDDHGTIIGSVVLSHDVTDERQTAEREAWRRRRAECLANLGLETAAMEPGFDNLNETARRVSAAVAGTVQIFLYRAGQLDLAGFSSVLPGVEPLARFITEHPYRPGEGLPGTVFQIGRPLLFYEIRGNAVVDFARNAEEKARKAALREQSLIACPIESYGERIGALVVSQSDPKRNFDAEDLEFAQSVAERIGAASHINRLTRVSQEGHRAADELARREVDARVRFENVLETAPIGIAVVSADELRFDLANARFLEFAAEQGKITSETKVIGLRAEEVIPGFEKVLKQVAESGETRIDQAIPIVGVAGPRYFNRVISAARGRFSGTTQNLTVLTQDVTEQVRAKREIEGLAQMMAERSARLDSILGSMTDGLWVYDASGSVIDVNQSALTMFGLGSRKEAIEIGSFELFQLRYPDGRAVPQGDLPHQRALRGITVPDYLGIGRHLLSGKDLDLSIAAAPIESNGVVGAILVIRDITALQELDRKKDEFLSVASHELRTPLTTIKGYTQLLEQTINDLSEADRTTYLTAVLGEIDRMMGLISELLDVSRIETNRLQIHPQPIPWLDFIDRRVSAFRVQNPARTIDFDAAAPQITVHADPDRMRQVIDNLLSNAIKYSPDGSEVHVSVKLHEKAILTSVVDFGIGIPSDEIPQLFERFHRARNVSSRYYGGLGLGLYIARAIVEAHGGAIRVESEENQGSAFTLSLPVVD